MLSLWKKKPKGEHFYWNNSEKSVILFVKNCSCKEGSFSFLDITILIFNSLFLPKKNHSKYL